MPIASVKSSAWKRASSYFIGVLAAVAHAHSHLIVHRDIKPSNIFVTAGGTVKLLDFGIAKLLQGEGEAVLTQSSAIPLTPQYAAPEQLLGKPVTTATDVYSLGLVLYELLTGAHPLAAGARSNAELMRAVLTEEPARASAAVDGSDDSPPRPRGRSRQHPAQGAEKGPRRALCIRRCICQ